MSVIGRLRPVELMVFAMLDCPLSPKAVVQIEAKYENINA